MNFQQHNQIHMDILLWQKTYKELLIIWKTHFQSDDLGNNISPRIAELVKKMQAQKSH